MMILIAPNAFKGSLGVLEVARAIRKGVHSVHPSAEIIELPISDGGDGLIDALLAASGGSRIDVTVRGPLGERRPASFGWLSDKTAVIEMALASGLALVPKAERDPLRATSFGTGQLVDAALRKGARTIVIGLGGSASSDGGAGMAQALGCRLLDAKGRQLSAGAASLLSLARVDCGSLKSRLRGVKIVGLTDVRNPLTGPRGSAAVFGPQKGASTAQVRRIEAALRRYAAVVARDLGVSVARAPGAGAAGGLGAGLLAFLRARLIPGADYVLARVGFERLLRRADAVVTGEGRLDETSFLGKAPVELARACKAAGVPVAAVCGAVAPSVRPRLPAAGIAAAVALSDAGARGDGSVRRCARWTAKAAALAVKSLGLAALVVGLCAAAPPDRCREVDKLYFQRDQPGKLDEAAQALEKLVSIGGADAGLWWRYARVLVREGERNDRKKDKLDLFGRAQDAARKAIALDAREPEAHFWLGAAMGRYGQTKGIFKSLSLVGSIRGEMRETLRLDPGHGGAHHVLGEILWQVPGFAGGDKRRALAEFEEAVRLTPDYSANYPSLAKAYLKFGEKEKARALLERLEKLGRPADPPAYPEDLAEVRRSVGG